MLAPPARIGLATFGLGTPWEAEAANEDSLECGQRVGDVAERLVTALAELGAGEPFALRRLIEAAEAAVELLSASAEPSEAAG